MKNYIQYIPLTAFAAAIVLGGSLRAEEAAPAGTGMRDQQSQRPGRTADDTGTVPTPDQVNWLPMTASDVLGMNIDTADNEKIGEIDEVFIDSHTGEVLAMVVSTGGLLGTGQEQSLLSPKDLRLNAERTLMQTDISKDQIRNAPRYQKGETAGLDQVRPLGKTASVGEERTERMNRSERGRNAPNRRTAGEERTERTDRSERGPNASDRRAAGEERTERMNRNEGEQSQVHALAISQLIEMSVVNRQGETVGDVNEAFLDLENWEVAGVVVSTGGFLGVGERKTLFGLPEMSFDPANEKVVLDYSRDQILEFPEFNPDEQSVFEDLRERMDRLAPGINPSAAVQQ